MRRVVLSCEWPDLQSKLHTLRIASPDGLFSGNECLTFISKGKGNVFVLLCWLGKSLIRESVDYVGMALTRNICNT